ncbi:MAG: hypothetical protein IJ853_00335 [Rickettsiales bacterium]|nr:hypothetical protein [Rickettsiales bacterium]
MFEKKINEEENNIKIEDILYLLGLVADKVGIDFNKEKNVDITKDRLFNIIESIKNNSVIKQRVFDLIHGIKKNGGPGSGIKGHKTLRPIKIDGRRKFKDYKDLSRKAREYYKKNIQGKSIDKDKIGRIDFLRRGIEETISKGNPHYIFQLPKIIDSGQVGEPEALYKKRKDTDLPFNIINNKVIYKDMIKDVAVKVRSKKDGEKDFYLIKDDDK